MMEQCLGCGLTPLLAPTGATRFHPHSLPRFSPPFSSRLGGALSPHEGTGRSTWPTDGLAVVEDKGEGRGPALRRMKETDWDHRCRRCRVRSRLTLMTSSCFSCRVMLTVVTCLPTRSLFHKSACECVYELKRGRNRGSRSY